MRGEVVLLGVLERRFRSDLAASSELREKLGDLGLFVRVAAGVPIGCVDGVSSMAELD